MQKDGQLDKLVDIDHGGKKAQLVMKTSSFLPFCLRYKLYGFATVIGMLKATQLRMYTLGHPGVGSELFLLSSWHVFLRYFLNKESSGGELFKGCGSTFPNPSLAYIIPWDFGCLPRRQ